MITLLIVNQALQLRILFLLNFFEERLKVLFAAIHIHGLLPIVKPQLLQPLTRDLAHVLDDPDCIHKFPLLNIPKVFGLGGTHRRPRTITSYQTIELFIDITASHRIQI